MPGLVRGVARTAVIAGTATAVSNRVSRRQVERWSEEAPAQSAPSAPFLRCVRHASWLMQPSVQ